MTDLRAGEGWPEATDRAQQAIDRLEHDVIELRRSRARLLLAADADRRAIERALHDGLQQRLVALAVGLRRATRLVDDDPVAARESLNELGAYVRDAMDEAAELSRRIYPPRLHDARGLVAALRLGADRAHIAVTIQVAIAAEHPPATIAGIYWCCVDALGAASAGTQATIGVVDADGGLRFRVGVEGRYPDELVERLRDRVEALGGSLTAEDDGDEARVEGTLPATWG